MKVAVIGCGLIGEKRTRELGEHRLVIAADTDIEKARRLTDLRKQGIATTAWQEAARHPEVDLVIVATTNDWLAPITMAAVEHGKHVLVEKPAACSPEELDPIIEKMPSSGIKVKVGFNHRFHPALMKAREIVDSGVLGDLLFLRGRYGHGGRPGYEKEWRADPRIAGGGELLDQGVHLIDLSRWFLGDFSAVEGFARTYFWDMPVEDNGFLALRTSSEQMAWLHVSCSEWKNMFSLEIYGRYGKLQVDGLGGSYGVERLAHYRMLPQMGPPATTIWEYPFPDNSWKLEFDYFLACIRENREPAGNLEDARAALHIVHKIYRGKRQ